jgi:hypothetical protein
MRAVQDYDLWLRCATKGLTLLRSGLPLVMYRQIPNQVSRQPGYEDKVGGLLACALATRNRRLPSLIPCRWRSQLGQIASSASRTCEAHWSMRLPLRTYYSRLLQSQRLLLIEV